MSTRTLNTTLPGGTLYVSGTVNGVSTTWTNTEGNIWETVADRSSNDIYYVELTIINSAGTSSEVAFTLYYGLHLITDRTKADVERVKYLSSKGWSNMTEEEQAEWSEGMKGSYNASDLNRVGSAMEYLESKFNGYGFSVSVSPRLDWKVDEIPTVSDMAHYLSEVSFLRGVLSVMQTTPEVPEDMDLLTYIEANNIEKILEDIDRLLNNMAAVWFYSGEVFSGEVLAMSDRVPVDPNRVLISPESGGASFYATVIRADNSTQEGTPLNKKTLLSDETAEFLGLTSEDPTVDEAIEKLGTGMTVDVIRAICT